MHITVFSVKGFTGNALKDQLEVRLHHHQVEFTLEEVHLVDRFIQEGLHSVPAIKVDEKVFIHPHDGSIDETVSRVVEYVLMEKVKSILIPLDFSKESMHALTYARMMAENHGLGLTLVHIHQPVYDPVSAGALDIQLQMENQKRLEELVHTIEIDNLRRGITMPVTGHVEVGEATASLVGMSRQDHFAMIVMSTKNADNFFRRLFGTISSKVSRHSHIPVLVVPPETKISFPFKMVVGFTDELLQDGSLEYIVHFGARQHVVFDFVHITDDVASFTPLKAKLDEKLHLLSEQVADYHIRSLHTKNHPIDEVLFHYSDQVDAGMLILVSHHRGFLETLGHSSVTQKALRHPSKPVMVIHHPMERAQA